MKRPLSGALLALGLVASPLAWAGWSITGDVEHFEWKESTTPSVTEKGPRFGIGAQWTQDRLAGWLFGYRGRLYFGSVDYNGAELLTGVPLTGTTDYGGMTHEGQAIFRVSRSPYGAELVAGLGVDYWKRQLTSVQSEEYRVLYLRIGAGLDPRQARGWYAGGGVKYPLSVDENAHFPDIGFDPNPRLHPKGQLSPYAEVGYRFAPRLSLSGYYDSYRFGESSDVGVVQQGTGTPFTFFQPRTSVDTVGLRLRYSF